MGVAGKAWCPLEAACNITPSEVTRNPGDLFALANTAHLPLITDRTSPSSLCKAASSS